MAFVMIIVLILPFLVVGVFAVVIENVTNGLFEWSRSAKFAIRLTSSLLRMMTVICLLTMMVVLVSIIVTFNCFSNDFANITRMLISAIFVLANMVNALVVLTIMRLSLTYRTHLVISTLTRQSVASTSTPTFPPYGKTAMFTLVMLLVSLFSIVLSIALRIVLV